jgi:hypothetical protein
LVPRARSIAYLRNPTNPVFAESETREVQVAAQALGVRLLLVNASRPSENGRVVAENDDAISSRYGMMMRQHARVAGWKSRSLRPLEYPNSEIV